MINVNVLRAVRRCQVVVAILNFAFMVLNLSMGHPFVAAVNLVTAVGITLVVYVQTKQCAAE